MLKLIAAGERTSGSRGGVRRIKKKKKKKEGDGRQERREGVRVASTMTDGVHAVVECGDGGGQ